MFDQVSVAASRWVVIVGARSFSLTQRFGEHADGSLFHGERIARVGARRGQESVVRANRAAAQTGVRGQRQVVSSELGHQPLRDHDNGVPVTDSCLMSDLGEIAWAPEGGCEGVEEGFSSPAGTAHQEAAEADQAELVAGWADELMAFALVAALAVHEVNRHVWTGRQPLPP